MKNLNFKDVLISSLVIYVLGITAYLASFLFPLMEDPELQANLILMIAIAPAALLGGHLYYRRGHWTHGFVLGCALFASAIVLDAVITVPLFIIPNGGNHISFFGDPGFWLIGFEYVAVVVAYWKVRTINSQIKHQS